MRRIFLATLPVFIAVASGTAAIAQSAGNATTVPSANPAGEPRVPPIKRRAIAPDRKSAATPAQRAIPDARMRGDRPLETLKDCMAFWDPQTHMTKAEWRATCLRNQNQRR